MRNTRLKSLAPRLCATAIGCAALVAFSPAPAATVAQWTFEAPNTLADASSVGTYPNAIAAAIGSGTAGGVHASSSTAWSTPAGNGSANSFSANNWAVGDYFQFSTSTLGFFDVALSWDQTSSNTGPRDFKLAYSTNGTTFTDFATYSVLANASPNAPWNPTTSSALFSVGQDLTAIPSLDDQANVVFRLIVASTVAANGGSLASAGTGRVDNFTVLATPVPEPQMVLMLLGGLGCVLLAARRRDRSTR